MALKINVGGKLKSNKKKNDIDLKHPSGFKRKMKNKKLFENGGSAICKKTATRKKKRLA